MQRESRAFRRSQSLAGTDEIAAAIDIAAENLNASHSDWSLNQGSIRLELDTDRIALPEALAKAPLQSILPNSFFLKFNMNSLLAAINSMDP